MNDNIIEESNGVMTTKRVSDSSYGNAIAATDTIEPNNIVENVTNNPVEMNNNSESTPKSHGRTYIEIVATKDEAGQPMSVLEVDLIISREKGKESRRLTMNFAEIDEASKQIVEKSVNIDRDSFNELKEFFSNLDWNS